MNSLKYNNKNTYDNIKTPLCYQMSEYDCGQTTILNAIRFLFKRSEIDPEVIRKIMQITLDVENGKGGTSIYAMEYISKWLNNILNIPTMKMNAKFITGDDVNINNNDLKMCLKKGGVAIFRVWQLQEHYVLCTGIDEKFVYIFDPYYININDYEKDEKCQIIEDKIFEYNRKVQISRFYEKNKKDYTFVEGKNKSMILINKI